VRDETADVTATTNPETSGTSLTTPIQDTAAQTAAVPTSLSQETTVVAAKQVDPDQVLAKPHHCLTCCCYVSDQCLCCFAVRLPNDAVLFQVHCVAILSRRPACIDDIRAGRFTAPTSFVPIHLRSMLKAGLPQGHTCCAFPLHFLHPLAS